ncbi:hypothetical protein [Desulfonatronum thioautotrophicum]|uniref:hypothetical protein n=1 Tax=Desulfonatronum thioautotrophicum TaxID=617001 RepID=UPI0012947FA9|nr:hypothetical protein [Desulfonatronum thioautotrophicum]
MNLHLTQRIEFHLVEVITTSHFGDIPNPAKIMTPGVAAYGANPGGVSQPTVPAAKSPFHVQGLGLRLRKATELFVKQFQPERVAESLMTAQDKCERMAASSPP